MNTIAASSVDGQTFTVDLHRVSGLDALLYRQTMGEDLDFRVGVIIGTGASGTDAPLADVSVVKWLWMRQNENPNASLAEVAATVPMFPEPPPEGVATSTRPDGGEG